MSEFLERINRELENKDISEWFIDDIINDANKECCDEIEFLLYKYNIIDDSNSLKVSLEDAEIIISNYKDYYNILIKAVLDYLIALSPQRNKSKLIEDSQEIIELYFDSLKSRQTLSFYNLSTILTWTMHKFPKSKEEIKNSLLNKIIADGNEIDKISIVTFIISENVLCNLFSFEDYNKIYDIYFAYQIGKQDVEIYINFYDAFFNYLVKNKKESKSFLIKFSDFIIKNADKIDVKTKIGLLEKVRKYMNKYGLSNQYEMNKLIEKGCQEIKKTMFLINVSLSEENQEKLKSFINQQEKDFKSLSNVQKVIKLMSDSFPLSLETLKKSYEDSKTKNITARFFKERFIFNNRVVDNDSLNEEERFSLKSKKQIIIIVDIYCATILTPFIRSFILDNQTKEYFYSLLANNYLVSKDYVDYYFEPMIKFFDKDYRNSVYDLIETLEKSLRFYFENQKMNIYKKNSDEEFIGLSDIFNNKEENIYRDKLLETIDEDFYFTLKWFLTDHYGFAIKHRISHRYEDKHLYEEKGTLYIVIQIIRLYFAFQK